MAETYTRVKDIVVNITTSSAAGSIGLGIPLVIEGKATTAIEYKECSALDEVLKAGFTVESEVYKACASVFSQKHRPKTIAVCATTEKLADWLTANVGKNFRQIIPILGTEDSTIAELVTTVGTLEHKMLFLQVKTVDELPATQSERVVAVVYNGKSEHVNAAVVGESAGYEAGQFTYKNLVLSNVEAEDLTQAEVKDIHDAGGMCIIKKAGDVVTSEGKTTDGEYIDVVDSKDYIVSNIVYQGQKLLNDNKRLNFDNVGISQLENVVTGVLAAAYVNGIIATTEDGLPAYSTTFLTREEISASERADRTYNGGSFTFDLTGAIHNATINGTIEV